MDSLSRPWGLSPDQDAADTPSLRKYLDTIRERWWLILLAVVVCTGVAAAYVATAPKVYEAHADMLITPVPDDSSTPLGLGLIRRASDPSRDVTTASRLIDNQEIAAQVARTLRSPLSPQALLGKISVDPVAQSSIVSITAKGDSPRAAQELANAFGSAAVNDRTTQLHHELGPAIARLRARIKAVTPAPTSGGTPAASDPTIQPLQDQLATLEELNSAPDPTFQLATPASAPTAPSSPRTHLSIAGGVIAGLLLGIIGAFAVDVLDPRRQREDRLAALGLPVLTRVPLARRASYGFDESFRFLRTTLRFATTDESLRTIAVTSASDSEGKTTTSFQLAMAALEAGQSVLLVEADVYRPGLRRLVTPPDGDAQLHSTGVFDYLADTATLGEIIQPTAVPGLSFVAAGYPSAESITGLLETERGRAFVSDVAGMADVVVLDCPPVGPRSDAVLIAAAADGVLLVVDLKRSSVDALTSAVSHLHSASANVLGAVVNRDEQPGSAYEYRPVSSGRFPTALGRRPARR